MTSCLAAEVAEFGVNVLAYTPGIVKTAATEYLANSPAVHQSVRDSFRSVFADGRDTQVEEAVAMYMFLAPGRADALTGRHLSVDDDETDLLDRTDEILRDDLYKLRRVRTA